MELKNLYFFKKVAETQHITKAAEELNVSQSYLSKMVAELEAELGTKLFNHVGRGIVLNKSGKVFYERTIEILNSVHEARKEMDELAGYSHNEITVITNVVTYMPGLLKSFYAKYPNVKVFVKSEPLQKIQRAIQNGEADFAITTPILADAPEITSQVLMNEYASVIYPDGHWLEKENNISLSKLCEEPLICVAHGYGTRTEMERLANLWGLKLNIMIECADTPTVYEFVKAGLGIAFVPVSIAMRNLSVEGRYLDKAVLNLSSPVVLSWRKKQYLSKVEIAFKTVAEQYFKELSE